MFPGSASNRMTALRLARLCLLVLGTILATACSEPENTTTSTGPATSGTLRIGTNLWIGYEPLYYANRIGLHEKLNLSLVELPSASNVMQALRNGEIDAATLTLDETLRLLEEGLVLRVILVLDSSRGGDAIIARPEIQSLAALSGKRIGVEKTAVGALMLAGALKHGGLSADQVELVPLTVNEHEGAYLKGDVDAIVTFDPVRSRLLTAGASQLFDSSQIPDQIVDVLVATEAAIRENNAQLRGLVAAHFQVLAELSRNPEQAYLWYAARLGLEPDQVEKALAGIHIPTVAENYQLLEGGPQAGLNRSIRAAGAIMLEQQMLDHIPATDRLPDAGFLPPLSAITAK